MSFDELNTLQAWHEDHLQPGLDDRRLTQPDLLPFLRQLGPLFQVTLAGRSFESRPIHKIVFGQGGIQILIWTQMHGNESTGTRAVLDLFKWIDSPGSMIQLRDQLLEQCTVTVLPMLNPDGAERYTRLDSQGIDLNRDVIDKKAPESRLLQDVLAQTNPDYCFNMHDQRTIFSVGTPPNAATLSFLAPSEDENRTVTMGRVKTMKVIAAIYNSLKNSLGNRMGRYTDEFYPTATGDNFQQMGYSTILVESGHYPGDYKRFQARKFTFLVLLAGLTHLARNENVDHEIYFEIPNNEKFYLDRIVKEVRIGGKRADLGIHFKEELVRKQVSFRPTLEYFKDLNDYSADEVLDGSHLSFETKKDAEKWLLFEFN